MNQKKYNRGFTLSDYSLMTYLNDGKWLCSGSGGVTAEYPAYSNAADGTTPGCYMNP